MEPLNIHLMWGSVWERTCKDLPRKKMDFRRGLCGGKFGAAEDTPSVGLSMGEKL